MRNVKKKSLVVFVVVVVALGLSGWWLDSRGRLDIPHVTNVPRVLTGDDEDSFVPGEGHTPPTVMNTGGQSSEAMRPGGFSERGGEHGGEHGGTMTGLSVTNTLDMLSDVWVIGVMIAVVVYLSKVLGRLRRLSRRIIRTEGSSAS